MPITHATVAAGTDAGTGEIHKAEWNADHVDPPFKLTQLLGNGDINLSASTSYQPMDATNLAYLYLTLRVGDVVEIVLMLGQVYTNTGNNRFIIDFEVDQPTSANVQVLNRTFGAVWFVGANGVRQTGPHITCYFTATEAGSHGIRPIAKAEAGGNIFILANGTSFDDTAIVFSVKNLGQPA